MARSEDEWLVFNVWIYDQREVCIGHRREGRQIRRTEKCFIDYFACVVLEFPACSKPVLGFEVECIPDMVEHQVNGYLAPFCDDKGLAEGMRWVMERRDWE